MGEEISSKFESKYESTGSVDGILSVKYTYDVDTGSDSEIYLNKCHTTNIFEVGLKTMIRIIYLKAQSGLQEGDVQQ